VYIIFMKRSQNILSRVPWSFIGVSVALTIVMGAYVLFSPATTSFIVVLLLFLVSPLAFLYPRGFLLALFAIRTVLDIFGSYIIFPAPVPLNISSVLGVSLLVWGTWYIFTHVRKIPKTPIVLFSSLLLVAIASGYQSIDRVATLEEFIKLANLGIVFVIAYAYVTSINHYRSLATALSAAFIVPVIVACYQLFSNTGYAASVSDRLLGTFGHPNSFAFGLVLAIGLYIVLRAHSLYSSRIPWLPLALLIPLLIGTYTRGAWIGAAIVGFVYGIRYHARMTLFFFFLILSALFVLFRAPSILPSPISQLPALQRITFQDEETSSFDWRKRVWFEMRGKLSAVPLFGYGFGNFTALRKTTVSYETDLLALEAHNDYLRLAIELGYPGLLLYAAFYVSVLSVLLRALWHRPHDLILQKTYVAVTAVVVAFLVMAVADNVLQSTAVNWILFALMGGTVALAHNTSVVKRRP